MRTLDSAWQIHYSFRNYLLFWGYIGHEVGFTLDKETSQSSVENAWQTWWDRFLQIATLEEGFQLYQPPNFSNLADTPELQQLCRQHYSAFHHIWGHVDGIEFQNSVNEKLRAQLRAIKPNQLVETAVQAKAKTKANAFKLEADFVLWPADYYLEMAADHVVLGFGYLEPERTEALKTILEQHISALT